LFEYTCRVEKIHPSINTRIATNRHIPSANKNGRRLDMVSDSSNLSPHTLITIYLSPRFRTSIKRNTDSSNVTSRGRGNLSRTMKPSRMIINSEPNNIAAYVPYDNITAGIVYKQNVKTIQILSANYKRIDMS